jgi:hypothetical protein
LKAPGFWQRLNLSRKKPVFQAFAFSNSNLYRYVEARRSHEEAQRLRAERDAALHDAEKRETSEDLVAEAAKRSAAAAKAEVGDVQLLNPVDL